MDVHNKKRPMPIHRDSPLVQERDGEPCFLLPRKHGRMDSLFLLFIIPEIARLLYSFLPLLGAHAPLLR